MLYARARRVGVRRLDHLDPAARLGLSVPVRGASGGSGGGARNALKSNAPHFGRDVVALVANVDEVKLRVAGLSPERHA